MQGSRGREVPLTLCTVCGGGQRCAGSAALAGTAARAYSLPSYFRVNSWTMDAGTKTVVSFGSDATQGAYDLGTDGKDMVWHEGTGLVSVTQPAAHVDTFTASYVTDGVNLVKRRLRSEYVSGMFGHYFKVGCGYATSAIVTDVSRGFRVLRISDGVSWKQLLPATGPLWQEPLAITCDEVFMELQGYGPGVQIARIRLSTLPNPEQPD